MTSTSLVPATVSTQIQHHWTEKWDRSSHHHDLKFSFNNVSTLLTTRLDCTSMYNVYSNIKGKCGNEALNAWQTGTFGPFPQPQSCYSIRVYVCTIYECTHITHTHTHTHRSPQVVLVALVSALYLARQIVVVDSVFLLRVHYKKLRPVTHHLLYSLLLKYDY